MVEQTVRTSETITHWALASNLHTSHVYDTWMLVTIFPDYLLQSPKDSHMYLVGLCFHIFWCNAKGVGEREIVETFFNSASKNTPETDIFPCGTKSLLTSVSYFSSCWPILPVFCAQKCETKFSHKQNRVNDNKQTFLGAPTQFHNAAVSFALSCLPIRTQ